MKPATKSTIATAIAAVGLIVLAIINPRPADPIAPPQGISGGSVYDPTIKIAWSFTTIRRHPMQDGSRADVPFADVKSGDTARLVMVCGKPERECAGGTIKLPAGPLTEFRVVVIMHEVTLVYPIGAWMERSSWNRPGAIPAWERRINSDSVALLGRAREQVNVRAWEDRDNDIIADDGTVIGRRRAVRSASGPAPAPAASTATAATTTTIRAAAEWRPIVICAAPDLGKTFCAHDSGLGRRVCGVCTRTSIDWTDRDRTYHSDPYGVVLFEDYKARGAR